MDEKDFQELYFKDQLNPDTGLIGKIYNPNLKNNLGLPEYPDIEQQQDIFRRNVDIGSTPFYEMPIDTEGIEGGITLGTDLSEKRAYVQSAGEKLRHGLGKFAVTASTTYLDNMIGSIVGIGNVLTDTETMGQLLSASPENKIKGVQNALAKFVDNPFSNAMADINEWSEQVMPNYYTKAEQEGFLKGIIPLTEGSANFWGDKVLKNMGFAVGTIGAIASTKYFNPLSTSNKAGKWLVTKILKNPGEAAKWLDDIAKGTVKAADITEDMAKELRTLKNLKIGEQLSATTFGSLGESRFEAITNGREFAEKLKMENPNISEEEIENLKEGYMNMDFLMNMAILSISNWVQFKGLVGGTSLGNKLVKPIGELGAYKVAPKSISVAKGIGEGFKDIIAEGTEEQLQYAAQKTSELYYDKKYKEGYGDIGESLAGYLDAVTKGTIEAYSSKEGWENFVLGAITASILNPTTKALQSKKLSNIVPLYGDIKEQLDKREATKVVVDDLNQKFKEGQFQKLFEMTSIDQAYERDKSKAISDKDKFEAMNADNNQIVNLVSTMTELGKFDDLINFYEGIKNNTHSEEDIRAMFRTPEGVDIFKDDLGNDKVDVNEYLNKRIDKVINKTKEIKKDYELLHEKFGAKYNADVIKTLTQYLTTVKDTETRLEQLGDEIVNHPRNKYLDGRALADIYRERLRIQGKERWLDINWNKFSELEKAKKKLDKLKSKKALQGKEEVSKEITNTEEKISKLDKELTELIYEEFNKRNKVVKELSPYKVELNFEDFVQDVFNLISLNENFKETVAKQYEYNPASQQELQPLLEDMARIVKRRRDFGELYESAINNPERLANKIEQLKNEVEKTKEEKKVEKEVKEARATHITDNPSKKVTKEVEKVDIKEQKEEKVYDKEKVVTTKSEESKQEIEQNQQSSLVKQPLVETELERINREEQEFYDKLVSNNQIEIEYDTVEWNNQTNKKEYKKGKSKIIDAGGRKIIVLNINGMNIPFYLSTGHGGKVDVTSGKWYPIFGIAKDGWLNKLSGKEINDYYGSKELRKICESLDNIIGDIRENDNIPKVKLEGQHQDIINKDLQAVENGNKNTEEIVRKNIEKVKNHLQSLNSISEKLIEKISDVKVGDTVRNGNKIGKVIKIQGNRIITDFGFESDINFAEFYKQEIQQKYQQKKEEVTKVETSGDIIKEGNSQVTEVLEDTTSAETYNEQTVLAQEAEITSIEDQIDERNFVEEEGRLTRINVLPYAETIAGRSRAYKIIVAKNRNGEEYLKYENIDNQLVDDFFIKTLNPNKYYEGKRLTLRIVDLDKADELEIYHPEKAIEPYQEREKVKWGVYKNNFKDKDSTLFIENYPIEILDTDTGEVIGYVHQTSWITDQNVRADEVEQEREKNRELRKLILEKKEVSTIIKDVKLGQLFRTINNEKFIAARHLKDKKINIMIVKGTDINNNPVYSAGRQIATPKLLNKSNKLSIPGSIMIVPQLTVDVNREPIHMALPINNIKLKELGTYNSEVDTPGLNKTIRTAITIYMKNNEGIALTEEEEGFVKSVRDNMGLNLKGAGSQLRKFLKHYISLATVNYKEGGLKEYIENNQSTKKLGQAALNIVTEEDKNKIVNKLAIVGLSRLEIFSGRLGHVYIYEPNPNNKLPDVEGYIAKINNVLDELLSNVYTGASEEALAKDTNLVIYKGDSLQTISYVDYILNTTITNLVSQDVGDGFYTYMANNTVRFDTDVALGKNVEELEEVRVATTEEVKKEVEKDVDNSLKSLENLFGDIDTSQELPLSTLTEEEREKSLITLTGYSKEFLINGLTVSQQNQVVQWLVSGVTKILAEEGKVISKDVYNEYKEWLSRIVETSKKDVENVRKKIEEGIYTGVALENALNIVNKATLGINNIEKTLAVWNEVTKFVQIEINKLLKKYVKPKPELESDEDTGVTDIEDELDDAANTPYDKDSITIDPKTGVSSKVKMLFSGIIDTDETGKRKKNYLGQDMYLHWERVFNDVIVMVSSERADINSMIERLKSYTEGKKWVEQVIEKVTNASKDVQAQFVTALTKHTVRMWYMMYDIDPKGEYSFELKSSNATTGALVTINNWISNFSKSNAIIEVPDTDLITISPEFKNSLENDFNTLKDKVGKTTDEDEIRSEKASIKLFLAKLGITLNDKTLSDIYNGVIRNAIVVKGNAWNLGLEFSNDHGLFKSLLSAIKAVPSKGQEDINNIFNTQQMKKVAEREGYYSPLAVANSFRSGKETIYSHTNNYYLHNRLRDLLENNSGLPEILSKIPFSKNSYWLNKILNKTFSLFEMSYPDLDPFKQKGSKRAAQEFRERSEAEREVYKLALLQKIIQDPDEKGLHWRRLLYFTTSDKKNPRVLRVPEYSIEFTDEGELTDTTINRLVRDLIFPEILRIHQTYMQLEQGTLPNIKGYLQGTTQFLLFPELNNRSELFSENGMLKYTLTEQGELEDLGTFNVYKEVLTNYLNSLLSDKLSTWNKYGNIGVHKDKDATTGKSLKDKFLDKHFISVKLGNISKGQDYLRRAAAMDMIVQYLVSNVNIFQTITGDPSSYYKPIKLSDFIKGLGVTIEEAEASKEIMDRFRIAQVENTYNNISKRLAKDIAPGTEGNFINPQDKNVVYLFANDKQYKILDKAGKVTEQTGLDGDPQYKQQMFELLKQKHGERRAKQIIKDYNKMFEEETNAQEYVTWREHLNVMRAYGTITEKDYNEIIKNKGKLTAKQSEIVFQPMKPVYVWQTYNPISNIEEVHYVKTSAFPLFPELTANFPELEKIRLAMEQISTEHFGLGVRLNFGSGTKLGFPARAANIYQGEELVENLVEEFKKEDGIIRVLSRDGFRIQQEVPYDEHKGTIRAVTQAAKNLFTNILEVTGFKSVLKEGEVNGYDLQEEYHKITNALYKLHMEELLEEIADENGKLNIEKVKKVIEQEMIDRDYSINEIQSLTLDKDLTFIPVFGPSADKISSLLNSIVNNRVIKMKMPGKSFVLGSEMGFRKPVKMSFEEYIAKYSLEGVVFTKNFKGSLKPQRIVNKAKYLKDGTEELITDFSEDKSKWLVLPAQAFMPMKFRDNLGNLLDAKSFTDKSGFIDTNRIPQELLELFGMRIPNQGHNSQSRIEIVGFLPHQTGDLFIASRDYLAQMGSDFDVDKLYTYMYNTYLTTKGDLVKITEKNKQDVLDRFIAKEGDAITEDLLTQLANIFGATKYTKEDFEKDKKLGRFSKKVDIQILQNQLIDVFLSIHSNPDINVQSAIAEPLGFWEFKDIADRIKSLRPQDKTFLGISDSYQSKMYQEGSMGKAGIGNFSVINTFMSILQGKGIKLVNDISEEYSLTIGSKTTKGDLSEPESLEKGVYKTEVISGAQSVSVDNAKELLMAVLNMNSQTFNFYNAGMLLGFTEELPLIAAQDIIKDYVEEIVKLRTGWFGFYSNPEVQAYENIREKYSIEKMADVNNSELTIPMLESLIRSKDTINYNAYQLRILDIFRELSEKGDIIQKSVTSVINTDSAGLGKSYWDSYYKEEKIYKLPGMLQNIEKLLWWKLDAPSTEEIKDYYYIGDNKWVKPTTVNGQATVYGLMLNNKLWKDIYPYQQKYVKYIIDRLIEIFGKSEAGYTKKADVSYELFNEFKKLLFSNPELGLYNGESYSNRERLVKSSETNETLAQIIDKFKNKLINNPLINRLELAMIKNKNHQVKYNASAKNETEDAANYAAFLDLILNNRPLGEVTVEGVKYNYSTLNLAEDLASYFYLTGGIQEAIQFGKAISAPYLNIIGLTDRLSNIIRTKELDGFPKNITHDNTYIDIPFDIEEVVKHNASKIRKVEDKDITVTDKVPAIYGRDTETIEGFYINADKLNKYEVRRLNRNSDGTPALVANELTKVIPPEYLSIYDKNRGKGNQHLLFRYTGEKNEAGEPKYVRIGTKGEFGIDEYDYRVRRPSLKETNNTDAKFESVYTNTPKSGVEDIENTEAIDTKKMFGTPRTYTKDKGLNKLKQLLHSISINKNINPYYSFLAEEFLKVVDRLGEIELRVIGDNTKRGSYRFKEHHIITINVKRSNKFNPDELLEETLENVMEALLHETTHGLTNKYVLMWEQNKSALEKSNPEIYQALFSLEKNRIALENELKDNPEYQAFLEKERLRLLGEKDAKFTPTEVEKFYGRHSLKEFITMTLTNKEFQKLLNERVNKKTGKSWLDTIIDDILNLLEKIGINLKRDSVLEQSLRDILVLIKSEETASRQVEENNEIKYYPFKTNGTTFNYYGQKIPIIYNMETNEAVDVLIKQSESETNVKFLERKNKIIKAYNDNKGINPQFKGRQNIEINIQEDENKKYELFPGVYANEGQKKAIDELNDFIKSSKQVFTLIGRGGTGKTTIIKKILENTQGRVGGITVSHKAKKVLGRSIGRNKVKTIASALAIKLDETTGNFIPDTYAREQGKVPIKQLDIIIIDEASMVSKAMYDEIMELKRSSAKVIFMGDNAQLPPIGDDKESPVFEAKDKVKLVEKMRQAKGSPILTIGEVLAENIESSDPKLVAIPSNLRVNKSDTISKSKVIFTNSEEEVLNMFVEDFKKADNNPDYAKIITFNNERHNAPQSVKNLNDKIRNKIWGKESSNQFNIGELVTAYDTYTKDIGADEDQVPIHNADDFIVQDIEEKKNYKGRVSVFSKARGTRSFDYEYDIINLELVDSDGKDIPGSVVPVIANSSKEKFEKDLANLWATDKQLAFALKGEFANIQYGYAITSHKAQGSTYVNTYVMEDNILGNTNASPIKAKNQSLYVAVSRPTTKLVMLSNRNNQVNEDIIEDFLPSKEETKLDKILEIYNSSVTNRELISKDIYSQQANKEQLWFNYKGLINKDEVIKVQNKVNGVYVARVDINKVKARLSTDKTEMTREIWWNSLSEDERLSEMARIEQEERDYRIDDNIGEYKDFLKNLPVEQKRLLGKLIREKIIKINCD